MPNITKLAQNEESAIIDVNDGTILTLEGAQL